MKLTDLNPGWVSHGGEGVTISGKPVPQRIEIGIMFDCPCGECDEYHRCCVTFENPPDGKGPVGSGPHWHRDGVTFETLTLRPSIKRVGGCGWHGFITNGEAVTC